LKHSWFAQILKAVSTDANTTWGRAGILSSGLENFDVYIVNVIDSFSFVDSRVIIVAWI
jgi:hypothetical protein